MKRLKEFSGGDTMLIDFWYNLKQGYDIFNKLHQELKFRIDNRGKYIFLNKIYDLSAHYHWCDNYDDKNRLINRIAVPESFQRLQVQAGSFADWLRKLPLKEGNPKVYLFNREPKHNQNIHVAVLNIDTGNEDLQQCADAIIRLFAEYLSSQDRYDDIEFKITNGDVVKFRSWISGDRPKVRGNRVTWQRQAQVDSSYKNFRKYLNFIFKYAGTYSLSGQLKSKDVSEMAIGDIFIQGGFPGHAILVLDLAVNDKTGEKIFLLGQSFSPAHDFHILKNLNEPDLSPWYRLDFGDTLWTPEWTFYSKDLKGF